MHGRIVYKWNAREGRQEAAETNMVSRHGRVT